MLSYHINMLQILEKLLHNNKITWILSACFSTNESVGRIRGLFISSLKLQKLSMFKMCLNISAGGTEPVDVVGCVDDSIKRRKQLFFPNSDFFFFFEGRISFPSKAQPPFKNIKLGYIICVKLDIQKEVSVYRNILFHLKNRVTSLDFSFDSNYSALWFLRSWKSLCSFCPSF